MGSAALPQVSVMLVLICAGGGEGKSSMGPLGLAGGRRC